MWPYGVLWILGAIAVVLFIYKRVISHLEHKKNMAEIKQMFVDLRKDREI